MAPLFALASLAALLSLKTSVTATVIDNKTFEYVVIGSGPGGGPLASNLARAGHSVLLLEAGDDQVR
jgi:choline dehydrogenase